MENIIKNKLQNYGENPPEYILQNLKQNISFTKPSFVKQNKYIIAGSFALIIISAILFINNINKTNKLSKIEPSKQQNIISNEQKQIIEISTIKEIEKEHTKNNNITQHLHKTDPKNYKNITTISTQSEAKSISKTIEINAGQNKIICGNTCQLAAINTANGEWFTDAEIIIEEKNNPNSTIKSLQNGSFNLIWKENNGDEITLDTVNITFINTPKFDVKIEKADEICFNKNGYVIFNTKNNYTYLWNDGLKTNNIRENLKAGNYNVTVSNKNCSDVFNIKIENSQELQASFYHTELYSSVDVPIYFTNETQVKETEKATYKWIFDDGTTSEQINSEHIYKTSGEYNVKLIAYTKNGCVDSTSIKLKIYQEQLNMPNIFTPNGDGINDLLILNPKPLTNYKAFVFNRNGVEVSHWEKPNLGWNGKLNTGDDATEGVYYYVVTGIGEDGKNFQYKSFVNLNR
jgi:gliding motility-associated-like protein